MTKAERKAEAKKAYAALMKYYPLTLEDLGGEQWRDVPDYEGFYQESTFGRTKSFQNGKVTIRKPYIDKRGYLYVELYKDGKRKHFGVHRLVAICFIPNLGGKREVNHRDGRPMNNHVSNLEWATGLENIRHAVQTGLLLQGEECPWAKLTNEQVRLIRDNPNNLTCKQLGEMFSVDRRIIGDIQRGAYYKKAGGLIRQSKVQRTPEDVCEKIRAEYQRGVVGHGGRELAKKYGLSPSTILRIIHEND